MINLRKMDEEQYRAFIEYFIADYAVEIMENYKRSKGEALQIAEHELRLDLPKGIETENNALLCIELEEEAKQETVGYLWYKEDRTESSAFIYDFYVRPEYRNRGYGKRSMQALETKLKSANIKQIKLRVAFSNERALALYKELGFNITGINMAKNLAME